MGDEMKDIIVALINNGKLITTGIHTNEEIGAAIAKIVKGYSAEINKDDE